MRPRSLVRASLFLSLFASLQLAPRASADVKLPALFGEHMVLQQGVPVPVWGTAEPGEQVTVTLGGKKASAAADASGKWSVKLDPLPAGGPLEMIVAGKNTLTVKDVLAGEVWVASGQSNMEWSVNSGSATEQEKAAANHPQLRMFTVKRGVRGRPTQELEGTWVVCQPQTVGSFSAVGYFFGKEIQKALGAPVGILHTSWGGTPAEAWTERSALEADPDLKPILDRWQQKMAGFAQALDQWKSAAEKADAEGGQIPSLPEDARGHPWRPAGLYNAMIAPLAPYPIKGAIWYQGESNADRPYQYRKLLPAMIQSWRKAWGQGDFPFLIVSLANFMPAQSEPGESEWAELREAQAMTAAQPNNGLAVAIDIGDAADIHPRNKEDVGKRLALNALAVAYKKELAYSGPVYESMSADGDKIRLKFEHAKDGLVAKGGGVLKGFAVAGEDKKWAWADAKIEGVDTVVVRSDKVAKPVAARYAWANNPECNLVNAAALPAVPFRTDDWRGPSADRK